jgi:hypothetical protein
MTPVVNGLQAEFAEAVDVLILNAGVGIGQQVFETYALPGHPSFVLLDAEGGTIWRAFGPQAAEELRTQLEGAISSGGAMIDTPVP